MLNNFPLLYRELCFLALQNNYLGSGMEYLPIKEDDWTTWTWEVDADNYVTKITETTEDETYGTAYTFTYENIE